MCFGVRQQDIDAMNDSTYLTRYLLGELSEDERTALEEQYIADPNIFGEVARAESDLVDDYVRGKLAPEAHERFERVYLARPQRIERKHRLPSARPLPTPGLTGERLSTACSGRSRHWAWRSRQSSSRLASGWSSKPVERGKKLSNEKRHESTRIAESAKRAHALLRRRQAPIKPP